VAARGPPTRPGVSRALTLVETGERVLGDAAWQEGVAARALEVETTTAAYREAVAAVPGQDLAWRCLHVGTIDLENSAGNIGSFVGQQERDRVGHLLRSSESPSGHHALEMSASLL